MQSTWAFLVTHLVENPPGLWETWVRSIPGLERSPGEGKGYLLQYSGLENSVDSIVHGVAKSQTLLSDFHFHFQMMNLKYISIIYFFYNVYNKVIVEH